MSAAQDDVSPFPNPDSESYPTTSQQENTMKLAILHISDIHLQSASDHILGRASAIAGAAAGILADAHACLLLCTGDVAYSGRAAEYALATDLFRELTKNITSHLPRSGSFLGAIVLPGNHDCDFTNEPADRQNLLERLKGEAAPPPTKSESDTCLAPQAAFRRFRADLEASGLAIKPDRELNLTSVYTATIGVDSVSFTCCNTAWMSRLREQPGSIAFPADELGPRNDNPQTVTVTCLHHPTHWLANRREICERLNTTADIIITGHEHVPGEREIADRQTGACYVEIEAPELQDRDDPECSSFRILVVDIDIEEKRRRLYEFTLDDEGHYQPDPADMLDTPDGETRWQPLLPNQLRVRKKFAFTAAHAGYLDEVELSLQHSGVGTIRLSQLFVYPDLQEVILNPTVQGRRIRGEKVLEFLLGSPKTLVTGEPDCGKTALAKTLCVESLQRGYVPVLLQATRRFSRGRRLLQLIEKEFQAQYEWDSLQEYKELPRKQKVLVVDDYHVSGRNPGERRELVDELANYAGTVILLSDEAEIDLAEMISAEGIAVQRYHIQPFGYVQRGELIERWIGLSADPVKDHGRVISELDRRIEEILGRNFVPSYPVFILALLQTSEATLPQDTRIGTYGAYYEILIRAQLMKGKSPQAYNTLTGYLSFLAYSIHRTGGGFVTAGHLRQFHSDYEGWSDLQLDFSELTGDLKARQILHERNGAFGFRYPYVFYYFLAVHIRDHLQEEVIRSLIVSLAAATHRRENANILLFVAHLTRDPFVVEALLTAARGHYSDVPPLRKLAGTKVVGSLGNAAEEVAYKEMDTLTARRAIRAEKDGVEGGSPDRNEDEDVDDELVRPIARMTSALRTVQVLGQVLRNFPGQLGAETKLDLARECYLLGARTWGFLFDIFEKHGEDLARDLTAVILTAEPMVTRSALGHRVSRVLSGLVYYSSYGFVKRIAQSMGASELSVTFQKLVQLEDCETVRLVRTAIALEYSPRTPEIETTEAYEEAKACPVSAWIVRQLVVEHITLNDVDTATKQRLCQSVDVKHAGNLGLGGHRRLRSAKHRKSRE